MRFWLAVGMALGLLPAHAAAPVPYEFAIPEFTKTVSIGVYDSSGQLVRRLAERAGIRDFEIGLNGLIGKWDGRNDAGETVAGGVYHLRGFAVGDLSTDGVAYHFNDWAAELGDQAPITRVLGIAASPHGGLCVLGETVEGRRIAFYYRPGSGLVWQRDLGDKPAHPLKFPALPWFHPVAFQPEEWRDSLIAADTASVAVVDRGTLTFFSALTGHEMSSAAIPGSPRALAFDQGKLRVAAGSRLLTFAPDSAKVLDQWDAAKPWRTLTAAGGVWLGADWDGAVWQSTGKDWTPLKLEGDPRVVSLSLAGENSFWGIAVGAEDAQLVGEFSLTGEFLKNLQTGDSGLALQQVTALPGGETVYVRSGTGERQQILGIRRMGSAETPGAWEIVLDKKIQASDRFGLIEGQPVAEVASVPDVHFTLRLRDSMTQQRKKVRLEMITDPAGVRLRSEDGLMLDSLIESPGVRRLALESGKTPGTLRLFVGKPGLVEEFLVGGLSQIALLDVGEVEWKN